MRRNEVAVAAFLAGRISFPRIWQTVEEVMDRHTSIANPTLDAILRADQWARAEASASDPSNRIGKPEELRSENMAENCRA